MQSLKESLITLAALGLIILAPSTSMSQDGQQQPYLVNVCHCQIDPNDPPITYVGMETCEDIEEWYLELDGQCVYDVEWRY